MFIVPSGGRGYTPPRMNGQPDKPEAIGQRLRALRIAWGYEDNQAGFAEWCGVSSQAWNNWERGRQPPRLDQASLIRQRAQVTTDFIYYGDMRGVPHDIAIKIERALQSLEEKRA